MNFKKIQKIFFHIHLGQVIVKFSTTVLYTIVYLICEYFWLLFRFFYIYVFRQKKYYEFQVVFSIVYFHRIIHFTLYARIVRMLETTNIRPLYFLNGKIRVSKYRISMFQKLGRSQPITMGSTPIALSKVFIF